MKKKRFSEAQIVKVLEAVESGRKVADVCREYGVGVSTYFNWKSKYAGMKLSDLQKLKELERENTQLKRMFADVSLENKAMRYILEKK